MSDESTTSSDDVSASGDESAVSGDESADSDAFSLPTCPRCGDPVLSITTRGPMEHVAAPCGCRVGSPDL